MKNILFIHQSAELYGSDKMLLLLLQNIDRSVFLPIVVLPSEGPLKNELEKNNIKVIVAPVLKLYRNIFTFNNGLKFIKDLFTSISILNKLHNEHHFELVYSNTLAVLLGALFSKKNKIKHIWHVHEIIERPKIIAWLFPKLLYFFSDTIICNSEATKENIIERENKNLKKIIVVHNGIPCNNINTNETKKTQFGYKENDIIIALIGRISRLKGHNLVLQTFNDYFKNKRSLKILFVGSPVQSQEFYLNHIEDFVSLNNLTESVKIIPFLSNLDDIWNIIDIALVPSTEKESFGLVAIEAMLAKKPVIASKHGGLKEIVIDNETGFLVDPNNKISLKEAIEKLILNAELRTNFGEKGFQRVKEKFSIESYVIKIEHILENN